MHARFEAKRKNKFVSRNRESYGVDIGKLRTPWAQKLKHLPHHFRRTDRSTTYDELITV